MSDAAVKSSGESGTKPAAKAEPVPAGKAESKQAPSAETKPIDKAEAKPTVTSRSRQAGKGSKRRPFNAQQYGANYETIRWTRGRSKRPGAKS